MLSVVLLRRAQQEYYAGVLVYWRRLDSGVTAMNKISRFPLFYRGGLLAAQPRSWLSTCRFLADGSLRYEDVLSYDYHRYTTIIIGAGHQVQLLLKLS